MKRTDVLVWIAILILAGTACVGIILSQSLPISGLPLGGATVASSSTGATSTAMNPQKPSPYVQYVVGDPNAIIVIDPLGRRAGIDASGTIFTEIPQSSYSLNGIPGHTSKWIRIVRPMVGQYIVRIFGVSSGSYNLYTDISDGQNSLPTPTYSGLIGAGQVVTYIQSYNPDNLASSTVVLEDATSSPQGI